MESVFQALAIANGVLISVALGAVAFCVYAAAPVQYRNWQNRVAALESAFPAYQVSMNNLVEQINNGVAEAERAKEDAAAYNRSAAAKLNRGQRPNGPHGPVEPMSREEQIAAVKARFTGVG